MPERKPIIGIGCYGRGKDPKRYSLPIDYVSAVRRAGGRAIIFPPCDDEPTAVLELVDGLLFPGGGDIEARRYGRAEHPTMYGVDPERDRFELALAKEAVGARIPTLAICRGIQVLNVALGGDLVQHLPALGPHVIAHRTEERDSVRHEVRAEAESLLARVCGATRFEVSSCHHQAPGRLGSGLRAVGRAEDGTIEAVELEGHPELLAVQWHPEETAGQDAVQQRLFDWLVARARLSTA